MATVIANYTNRTDWESPEVAITEDGSYQVFVRGDLGYRASVSIKLKGADGVFHSYKELTFTHFQAPAAVEVSLLSGDAIKVFFVRCESASVEIRK